MKNKRNSQLTKALAALLILIVQFQTIASANMALPGCQDSCGDIVVPYPFGIGPNYSFPGFELSCDYNSTLFLLDTLPVLDISLRDPPVSWNNENVRYFDYSFTYTVEVNNSISSFCYNHDTGNITSYNPQPFNLSGSLYRLNTRQNWLTAVGCDAFASFIFGNETDPNQKGGCLMYDCSGPSFYEFCSGTSCCLANIPAETNYFKFDAFNSTIYNQPTAKNFSWCSYAMITNNFSNISTDYTTPDKLREIKMPILLDWAIGNESCEIAQTNNSTYACKSDHSFCMNSSTGPGYGCGCSVGFEGNPYIEGGCTDIDECSVPYYDICPGGKCHNLPGTYGCSCRAILGSKLHNINGYSYCQLYAPYIIANDEMLRGVESKYGSGDSQTGIILVLGFFTGVIILCLWFAIATRIKLFEKKRQEKLKQKFFVQNRGLLLQQLIDSYEDTTGKMRIFKLDELEKATNGFDNALLLGQGGHGEVYKGILPDQRVVAIKRSKIIDQDEIDQFINEVVILSQINHRNVVKLFGCCLETEVPLLVYEFISNGTLFNHLHEEENCSLTWKHRLKIALETAGAISYLHSSASISVFHRDIKSSNILLDDYFTAKVSDFGASRSVQIDQTGITTVVQGTHGYVDPEYYYTGRLTQKSDVYSFGVILVELLTREKVFSVSRVSEGGSLVAYFSSAMEENRPFDILDPEVVYEENRTELEVVSKLAKMCLIMKGEDRPTMKEVEAQLETLWRSNKIHKHPWMSHDSEETLLLPLDNNAGTGTSYYSFEQELHSSSNFPR